MAHSSAAFRVFASSFTGQLMLHCHFMRWSHCHFHHLPPHAPAPPFADLCSGAGQPACFQSHQPVHHHVGCHHVRTARPLGSHAHHVWRNRCAPACVSAAQSGQPRVGCVRG
eukprot:1159864-Pelagomonas_calceolata.AAC.7